MRRWIPFLLLALVALGLFVPALGGDQVFFPMHTELLEPWRSAQTPEHLAQLEDCFNPEITDKNFLFHPDTQLMVEALAQGATGLVFLVSGEVTSFNGRNYLLPRVARRRFVDGNLRK